MWIEQIWTFMYKSGLLQKRSRNTSEKNNKQERKKRNELFSSSIYYLAME